MYLERSCQFRGSWRLVTQTKTERSDEYKKQLDTVATVPLNPGVSQHRLSGYQTRP